MSSKWIEHLTSRSSVVRSPNWAIKTYICFVFEFNQKFRLEVRLPGIEPGSNRWQRSILAIGPQTHLLFCYFVFLLGWSLYWFTLVGFFFCNWVGGVISRWLSRWRWCEWIKTWIVWDKLLNNCVFNSGWVVCEWVIEWMSEWMWLNIVW